MVDGLGDAIKAIHVAGKSNKAAQANLERATGGNDLCFVSNRSNLPTTLNKHTLYIFLDENNVDKTGNPSLTISSHKKQNIVLNDGALPPETILRLKEEVRNIPLENAKDLEHAKALKNAKSPEEAETLEDAKALEDAQSLEDTKALFKYARKNQILDKTMREKALRAGAEVAAVGLTMLEGATTLVAGRKYAPKGLKETTVRKTVKKGKQAFSQALDSSTVGKEVKDKAIAFGSLHSEIIAGLSAFVATPLSAVSGAVMGRASAIPIPDSKFKDYVVHPAINAADNAWDKAKTVAPKTTGAIEGALDAKNQFANSEFVSQGISMAGGVTAALGVTSGVGITAPISIPILATATVTAVGMSVNAETKRQELGREKHYLEDIAVNAYRIQAINKDFPNLSTTLGISNTENYRLNTMKEATSKTIGPNHSFAENSVAITAAIHTPFVFVKAATVAASPVTLTLHGVGLANAVTTQVSGKFAETDAKHQIRSEIDTLRRIVPTAMVSNDIYVLANNAKKMKVEAAALETVAKKFKKNLSIHEDKDAMKAIFDQAKKDEEARISQENNPVYSSQNLTRPAGMSQVRIHAQTTGKVLFGKKTTYQQNAGINPEAEEIISQLRPPPSKNQVIEPLTSPISVVADDNKGLVANPSNSGNDSVIAQAIVVPTVAVQGIPVIEAPVEKLIQAPNSPNQSSDHLVSEKVAKMRQGLDCPPTPTNNKSEENKKAQRRPTLSGRKSSYR